MKSETQLPSLTALGLDQTEIGSLLYVGSYKYYCEMVDKLLKRQCPFCQIDHSVNTVLYENESWRIWVNPFASKKNQALHLVIPHKRHITHIGDMDLQSGKDLAEMFRWASVEFNLQGGGVMMRFGDPTLNAGTVRHLHCNIQVPSGTGKLDITLAKDPEKVALHHRLLPIYEKMRLGTTFDQLPPDEQELVKDKLK